MRLRYSGLFLSAERASRLVRSEPGLTVAS